MLSTRTLRSTIFVIIILSLITLFSAQSRAQAALLMEEPYGFFGTVNPTGHTAIYFERICAETPSRLRRCQDRANWAPSSRATRASPDTIGWRFRCFLTSIRSRTPRKFPARVDRETVTRLREPVS
jgi:hypothetical protein